ncbi:MAG: acyl-CoA desaturase [Actinobacteria bacterium]|nr:acyl-CoA desaturase [Actinomycetota bacterium]
MAVLFTVGPLVGVAVAGALLWGRGLSAVDLALFLTFYLFTLVGVTVGYHRLFTHRSFEAAKPVRFLLALAGSLAVQGPIIEWVATHRRHHAYSDAYGDPHSPHLVEEPGLRGTLRGLWHAHMGWMFRPNTTLGERWAPDLEDEPTMVGMDRLWPRLTLVTFVAPALIGGLVTWSLWGAFTAFLWGSVVRVFVLQHVTWSINSICHFFGERPFESRDLSTNNWVLSLLSFGESWHNNHHAFPTSARHGLLRGQFDPAWVFIRVLSWIRLARDIRLPSPSLLQRKWTGTPERLRRLGRLPRRARAIG